MVRSGNGTETRMRIRCNRNYAVDAHRLPDKTVQLAGEGYTILNRLLDIKVSNEMGSMNPGISPATAGEINNLSGERPYGVVQNFLHRDGAGLDLPAMKRGSIERQFNKITESDRRRG
jgi:hypothetical protein